MKVALSGRDCRSHLFATGQLGISVGCMLYRPTLSMHGMIGVFAPQVGRLRVKVDPKGHGKWEMGTITCAIRRLNSEVAPRDSLCT